MMERIQAQRSIERVSTEGESLDVTSNQEWRRGNSTLRDEQHVRRNVDTRDIHIQPAQPFRRPASSDTLIQDPVAGQQLQGVCSHGKIVDQPDAFVEGLRTSRRKRLVGLPGD